MGASRIHLGAAVGKKRRGVAALDASTAAELALARGDRKAGPLFPSPEGQCLERRRLLERWRRLLDSGSSTCSGRRPRGGTSSGPTW